MPPFAFPFAAFSNAKDHVLHRKKHPIAIAISVSYNFIVS